MHCKHLEVRVTTSPTVFSTKPTLKYPILSPVADVQIGNSKPLYVIFSEIQYDSSLNSVR